MPDSDTLSALLAIPHIDPRPDPLPPPGAAWNAAPLRSLVVNASWATHLVGVLERLTEWDAWSGSEAEIFDAIQAIEEIISQLSQPQ